LLEDLGRFVVRVGRLDQDTSRLLLMTNDTQFAGRVANPDYKAAKTYLVKASTRTDQEKAHELIMAKNIVADQRIASGRTHFDRAGRTCCSRTILKPWVAGQFAGVRQAVNPPYAPISNRRAGYHPAPHPNEPPINGLLRQQDRTQPEP